MAGTLRDRVLDAVRTALAVGRVPATRMRILVTGAAIDPYHCSTLCLFALDKHHMQLLIRWESALSDAHEP